jgi:hydrogenase expression/formation protein HypC
MCLAVPARIEKMQGPDATVVLDGSRADVSLALVPEAQVGDWVLVHAGYAITVLDPEAAKETYDLLKEMDSLAEAEEDQPAGR